MTTTYSFKAAFTISGIGSQPSSAPVCTVVDIDDNVLANAQPATALSNLPGVYVYAFTGEDDLDPIGLFHTDDALVDQQDLFSYTPSILIQTAAAVSAVQAKTDELQFTIPNQVDANALSGGGTLGPGAISWPITINANGNPVDGVDVWVTTDEPGANVIARGNTDDSGLVTFLLDAGSYYAWKQLAGYAFTNPEVFTVS